jgi:hypothetical protein
MLKFYVEIKLPWVSDDNDEFEFDFPENSNQITQNFYASLFMIII